MRNYPTVDRESFQELLASAFAVQQMDSQSRSTLVEIGRSVTTGDLDVDEAVHLIVDRSQELESTEDVTIGQSNGAQLPSSTLSTVMLRDGPSTGADSADERVRPPEIKIDRFKFLDPSTLLLILVIAVALSVGWLLGRVTGRAPAHKKEVPANVNVKADATPPQSDKITQAESSPPPPIPEKASSLEMPSGDLVVYQDGKVVFRLPTKAQDDSSATDSSMVSAPKANVQVLNRVEPEYPEAARQQRIQGLVVLEATVGKDGDVQQLAVISGNPMLATAASAAVLKWRFKPVVQNRRAVQFQTRIRVDFVLP
jgi:TonB family protein